MSNPYISLLYEKAQEPTNYMTHDLFSNNPYNYKDLGNHLIPIKNFKIILFY